MSMLLSKIICDIIAIYKSNNLEFLTLTDWLNSYSILLCSTCDPKKGVMNKTMKQLSFILFHKFSTKYNVQQTSSMHVVNFVNLCYLEEALDYCNFFYDTRKEV